MPTEHGEDAPRCRAYEPMFFARIRTGGRWGQRLRWFECPACQREVVSTNDRGGFIHAV